MNKTEQKYLERSPHNTVQRDFRCCDIEKSIENELEIVIWQLSALYLANNNF